MLKICLFFFLALCTLSLHPLHANTILTVNIISQNLYNEAGKEVDVAIIKEELEKLGHCVNLFDFRENHNIIPADINIFLAQFKSDLFSAATLNWFIPNPDFCEGSVDDLKKFDLILCKTKESLKIFKSISKKADYLGFTSIDCYRPTTPKNFSKLIHVAGKSKMKGTEEVIKAWKKDSNLPKIILIKRDADLANLPQNIKLITKRVEENSLRKMQNSCGMHVCPSKTEGFGHYLMEAMSTEAVVITTDAPPMNEFIKDQRCLVKYRTTGTRNYATTYIVDEKVLIKTVHALQQLSEEELRSIGRQNREEYLRRQAEFKLNFERFVNQAMQGF